MPPEDRYSALKDLDALFTSQSAQNETSSAASAGWAPTWGTAPTQVPNKTESVFSKGMDAPNAWNAAFAPTTHSNNPFLGELRERESSSTSMPHQYVNYVID